ncbi:hypothetical protein [Frankia sp. R43]|uniref:hypothetical protein n=1 Tax=Frankia sp. R43 TaxID=269536 RepID=UPI001379EFD3|nr:hypothetical protein [Frankia sp. R43]
MSVRSFAAHLGVAVASVSNWERRGELIRLRDETQEILDRDLGIAGEDVRVRFAAALADPPPAETSLSVADGPVFAATPQPGPIADDSVVEAPPDSRRTTLRPRRNAPRQTPSTAGQ